MEITQAVAEKVLATVDAGLIGGAGVPEPGKMCVEAAVCYAMGLPHGDAPPCVSPALRVFTIGLTDSRWSSPKVRAKGMRRIALAQLGSAGVLDEREFVRRLADLTIRSVVPRALRAAASVHPDLTRQQALRDAADQCERKGTRAAASAASAASWAASEAASAASWAASAASDVDLTATAEAVVQILISMDAPGCQWLALTEELKGT